LSYDWTVPNIPCIKCKGEIIVRPRRDEDSVTRIKSARGAARAIAGDPPGRYVVIGGDDARAIVWDLETGMPKTILENQYNYSVAGAYSQDGKRIVTCDPGKIKVWDAESGKALAGFYLHTGKVNHVDFSPDASKVLSCADDSTSGISQPIKTSLSIKRMRQLRRQCMSDRTTKPFFLRQE
jgi:WD40 repeat protein